MTATDSHKSGRASLSFLPTYTGAFFFVYHSSDRGCRDAHSRCIFFFGVGCHIMSCHIMSCHVILWWLLDCLAVFWCYSI